MTELTDFLKLLLKRKYILIGIPLIAIIITYFLVRNMPDAYSSKARIATGMMDNSGQLPGSNNKQESEINQAFNNLVQMMLLKKMVDQVSYQLIIHDLNNNDKTFRDKSKLLDRMTDNARKNALLAYTQKYKTQTELSLYDPAQNKLNELLKSMGYDEIALRTKLSVYRVNNSDYIDIQFESENPELSAFAANTLCKEFINYYDSLTKGNRVKTEDFLAELLRQKHAAMTKKMLELKNYKIQNHILNLNEQAKSVFGQIADFETRRQTAQKEIISYTEALKDIDNKFKPEDRKYLEGTVTNINDDIVVDKDAIRRLNEMYVSSNFNQQYKTSMDSLRKVMVNKINSASDKVIFNPLSAKQDLVTQKLDMEIALDLSKNSVASLEKEIVRLNNRFDNLVPHEAVVQAYENDIDVASREYLEILEKYNQSSLQSNFAFQLRQIEIAMPGTALADKKMLLVILAGIISFVFCVIVLLVLFYFDDAVHEPKQLADKTKIPVLGYLNLLSGSMLDLKQVWQTQTSDKSMMQFKDLLRSIRFELEKEMGGSKILTITSIQEAEGKTFFAISLAYACAMANKKVLLIDGNFNNNAISKTVKPSLFIEDLFKTGYSENSLSHNELISVVGNKGADISLLEIADQATIKERLSQLKQQYDLVLIETSSLDTLNKAKEWILFSDKTIAVFEVDQSIDETKKQQVNYLRSSENNFIGWILNKVHNSQSKKSAYN